MDNCRHVSKISSSMHNTLLNPQKWLCAICGSTESVWACMTCSYVACGRYIKEHALDHYKETQHPISLEINDGYAYCYACDDYILNDNISGDLKLFRDILSVISQQKFSERSGGRVLRTSDSGIKNEDLQHLVIKFRRIKCLSKAFTAWKQYGHPDKKIKTLAAPKRKSSSQEPTPTPPKAPKVWTARQERAYKREQNRNLEMPPGVTGLRNLGNTCYMNSVLQVLSNLDQFREHFLAYCPVKVEFEEKDPHKEFARQSTVECIQRVTAPRRKRSCSESDLTKRDLPATEKHEKVEKLDHNTLTEEVHALLRVMWSGKLSLVIPEGFLHAVWNHVPSFKGYKQQDAQEFLCEILSKLTDELQGPDENSENLVKIPENRPSTSNAVKDTINLLFNGELESRVTCLQCKTCSQRTEAFSDLSLEFPPRLQEAGVTESCHITEMLSSFTSNEQLGAVYSCDVCCGQKSDSKRKRSKSSNQQNTEAEKSIKIKRLPQILRLHLKRFRWAGRNARQKLNNHVNFDDFLDMGPYCVPNLASGGQYRLCGVIQHHGRGFNSGHYTSYCWNSAGQFWLHCNDARLELCALNDVLESQAYILFYSRLDAQSSSKMSQSSHSPLHRSQSDVFGTRSSPRKHK